MRLCQKSGRAASIRVADDSATSEVEDELEEPLFPELGKAVRTKRFPMKPMTAEDAILEMELLSHSFFFYYNLDTNEYNVV